MIFDTVSHVFGCFNGQNRNYSRATVGGIPLSMGSYVYALSKLITIVNEILSDFPIYKMDTV